MKKLTTISFAFILMVSIIFIQPLKAELYTDINGTSIDLGSEGRVTGGGLTFLWDMPRFFDNQKVFFYINSTFAYSIKDKNKPKETVLTYAPLSAGIEYRYQILEIPLYLTGSVGAGASYFKKEGPLYTGPFMDPSRTRIDSDTGPYGDVMLGVNYILSQNAAFFIRGGYQRSFYSNDSIESPSGFQFNTGVRIPIFGKHRGLGGVDDVYDDSDPIEFSRKNKKNRGQTTYGFTPGVIVTFGEFKEISEMGYGGLISMTKKNLLFRDFELGIAPGFYLMETKDNDYDSIFIAPIYLTAGYRISIGESFCIKPVISLGGAYIDAKYRDRMKSISEGQDSHLKTFEPATKSGILSEYKITDFFTFSAGCEYGNIIEKKGTIHFVVVSAGVSYTF